MNLLRKFIKQEHPNYDFKRYHFQSGDFIELPDGARVCVLASLLDYAECFVYRRGLQHRQLGIFNINFEELPYYNEGEFINYLPHIARNAIWKIGDLRYINTEKTDLAVLCEEIDWQEFYVFVLKATNKSYVYSTVVAANPMRDYIVM